MDFLGECMALSDAFNAIMSFKDFYTIKHPKWYEPQVSLDNKVKVPRKKVLVFEDNYASKIEDDDTKTSCIGLVFSYEACSTSTHDGHVDGAHNEVSQSIYFEYSTSHLNSDSHDDESVEEPNYDEDLIPYHIYDTYDIADMIIPKYDEDWVFENLLWDMDPSSLEQCMEDDKGEAN